MALCVRTSNFNFLRNFYVKLFCCFLAVVFVQSEQRKINSLFLYTPKFGWINDPNGLLYARGIYHMFYQYNPYSDNVGNISWGHAVSRDFVRWEDRGTALRYNQTTQEAMFSGSGVLDKDNSSGLGTKKNPPLVLIYCAVYNQGITLADGTELKPGAQTMSLAYSVDNGENWEFYENNPVIRHPPVLYPDQYENFRDPKVFWYAPHNKWVMVNVLSAIKKAALYSSVNLKDWTYMSDFASINSPDAIWECPDLIELKVPGTPKTKWVLIMSTNPGGPVGGSGMHYYLGSFDGYQFLEEEIEDPNTPNIKWLDYGSDYYAAITWSNVDRGKFLTGWVNNWDYAIDIAQTYHGAQGFARQLTLDVIDGKIKLIQTPLKRLYTFKKSVTKVELSEGSSNAVEFSNSLAHELLAVVRDVDPILGFSFIVEGEDGNVEAEIGFDGADRVLYIRKRSVKPSDDGKYVTHTAPLKPNGIAELRIFVDSNCLMLFYGKGDIVFTELLFSDSTTRKFYLKQGSGSKVTLTKTVFSTGLQRGAA